MTCPLSLCSHKLSPLYQLYSDFPSPASDFISLEVNKGWKKKAAFTLLTNHKALHPEDFPMSEEITSDKLLQTADTGEPFQPC